MEKLLTLKEWREIVKRLTPEDLNLVRARISDVFAKQRRRQFKLIIGGRRSRRRPWTRDGQVS